MKSCHRLCTTTFAVLTVLLLIGACCDDDNPLQPTGHWEEIAVASSDYELDRFFRLDLPPNHLGFDAAVHGITRPDAPGRDENTARIDPQSIRVYRRGAFPPGPHDLVYLAATIDTSGVWDTALIAALTEQPDRWVLGEVWGFVDFTLIYTPDDELRAIDLGTRLPHDEVIAVTYDVIDTVTGDLLFKVGDQFEDGDGAGLEIAGQDYLRVKLLKPQLQDEFTFQYVLRNIYDLGIREIDPGTESLRIEARHSSDNNDLHGDHGIPYIQVFGLDVFDTAGAPGGDGLVDWQRPLLFDLIDGLLVFPPDFPHPFAAGEVRHRDYASAAGNPEFDWDDTWLDLGQTPEIYDWTTLWFNYSRYDYFDLVLRYWVDTRD